MSLLLAALAATMLLSGCAGSRGGAVPYDVAGFGAPDTPAACRSEHGYKIAPLDTLDIKVFQVEDLSGEYEVDLTGNIAMPLIGSVKATDRTTAAAQDQITQQLGAKYLKNPTSASGSNRRPGATSPSMARSRAGLFPGQRSDDADAGRRLARGTDEKPIRGASRSSARSTASAWPRRST